MLTSPHLSRGCRRGGSSVGPAVLSSRATTPLPDDRATNRRARGGRQGRDRLPRLCRNRADTERGAHAVPTVAACLPAFRPLVTTAPACDRAPPRHDQRSLGPPLAAIRGECDGWNCQPDAMSLPPASRPPRLSCRHYPSCQHAVASPHVLKSGFRNRAAISGLIKSRTRPWTTLVNATPMTMPTARSTTLPRKMNWRNSAIKLRITFLSPGGTTASANRPGLVPSQQWAILVGDA